MLPPIFFAQLALPQPLAPFSSELASTTLRRTLPDASTVNTFLYRSHAAAWASLTILPRPLEVSLLISCRHKQQDGRGRT